MSCRDGRPSSRSSCARCWGHPSNREGRPRRPTTASRLVIADHDRTARRQEHGSRDQGVGMTKLTGVELRRIRMPLVAPFRTSFGTELDRDVLLLRVVSTDSEGWGECVAGADPLYSSEYVDGAADVLRRFLIPAVAECEHLDANRVAAVLARFKGHPMAKAALEMGILDAELRARDVSLARELGAVRDRVPCGVSVGSMESIPALLEAVAGYLDAGYVRIKLKIEPGWDVEPVRAVRETFGIDVLLQVDANTAYEVADARQLARLDKFDLLLI